jgi:predicted nucleic acid-binding protein
MSVLIDTSVWVEHFRNRNPALIGLLQTDQALTHPWVVAELACGTPPAPRQRTLQDLELLQPARIATLAEIRALIENERLYGLGCGLVDLALLASTLLTPAAGLWTLDRRLADLARRFGVAFQR